MSPNEKPRYRAEMFDLMQYFFREYNDHQLHAVLSFGGSLDLPVLEKALRRSAELVPILGCRFVPDAVRPCWEQTEEPGRRNLLTFLDLGEQDPEAEIRRFLTGRTEELAGPQVAACVLRAGGSDTLCVLLNHMVCDGAGFKDYLYLLGELYTGLAEGRPEAAFFSGGSRSAGQIFRYFPFWERLRLFFRLKKPVSSAGGVRFPLSPGKSGKKPFILTHRLCPERFERLRRYGRRRGATVNDVVLAACFRALNRMLSREACETLTIPSMVDLRRYLPGKKAESLCNLASMVPCRIGPTEHDSFEETLVKVSAAMGREKSEYPGLSGLSALRLLFLLPFGQVARLLKKLYVQPLIGVTNIGVLDAGRLRFESVPVSEAYAAASIKYFPYFQLGFTTYRGAITFTVNEYGTEEDEKTVRQFFALLDGELEFPLEG